jgi:hypothetical protein
LEWRRYEFSRVYGKRRLGRTLEIICGVLENGTGVGKFG